MEYKTKKRDSNIELLRIVCMIMILNLHAFYIPASLSWKTLSIANIITVFSESLSICAVNAFVLISGYYSIKWKWRGFLSLIFQVFFFVFLIYFLLLIGGHVEFNWGDALQKINCIRSSYWFIKSYIVLYVLSPLLNTFIENTTKKQLRWFLIAFYVLEFYFCTSEDIINNGYSPLHFVGLYLLGRFLNKYPPKQLNSLLSSGVLYIVTTCCIALFYLGHKIIASDNSTYFNLFGVYANPLVVIQSIAFFYVFKNIRLKSKFINWCSVSVLAIYLLHMHPDLKQLYYSHTTSLYDLSVLNRSFHLIFLFSTIFVVSILIDKLRILVFNTCYKMCFIIKERNITRAEQKQKSLKNSEI